MSEQGALGEKRELAAKVLRDVLERMGVDAEVSAFDDGERIILDAHGSESGLVTAMTMAAKTGASSRVSASATVEPTNCRCVRRPSATVMAGTAVGPAPWTPPRPS